MNNHIKFIFKNYWIVLYLMIFYILIKIISTIVPNIVHAFLFWDILNILPLIIYFSLIVYIIFPVFKFQNAEEILFSKLNKLFFITIVLVIVIERYFDYEFEFYYLITLLLPLFIMKVKILIVIISLLMIIVFYLWHGLTAGPIGIIEFPAIIFLIAFILFSLKSVLKNTRLMIKDNRIFINHTICAYLIFLIFWIFKYIHMDTYSFLYHQNFILHFKPDNFGFQYNYFHIFLLDLILFSLFLRFFKKIFIPEVIYFVYIFIKMVLSMNIVYILRVITLTRSW